MFNRPVVFVDIETTGVSWKSSRIIEVAAIRFENDEITQEFQSLINPGTYLPEYISSITGITNDDLDGQPYFEDIAKDLVDICEDAIFIAHNVRFDYSFIKNHLDGCGFRFNPDLLCTVRVSRALFPTQRRHNLDSLIAAHNIEMSDRHRALDDAKALLAFCQSAYQKCGSEAFAQAINKQLRRRSLPPNLSPSIVDSLPTGNGVYIFEDSDGRPLYVGKSINIRKRVLSHFTQDNKIDKEMRLSLGVHNIRAIETTTELEALILEAKLVKELLPLHNRKLRRVKTYSAIVKNFNQNGYITLSIDSVDLNQCDDFAKIYGLFETRGKAKTALLQHQKTFSICPKLLGLEKGAGRCFQSQLGRCAGACTGKELPDRHNLRVELALERTKMQAWPFDSSIVVRHKEAPQKGLILDQWRIIGECDEEGFITSSDESSLWFDMDIYRILTSYFRTKKDQLLISPI
jgi:DNA polymerase-3 subunit epsilon